MTQLCFVAACGGISAIIISVPFLLSGMCFEPLPVIALNLQHSMVAAANHRITITVFAIMAIGLIVGPASIHVPSVTSKGKCRSFQGSTISAESCNPDVIPLVSLAP